MKKLIFGALAAAAVLVATPAAAQNTNFTGTAVGVNVGLTEDNDDISYGVNLGHDFGVGRSGILGFDVEATDFLNDRQREFGGGVRAGVAFHPNALVFARAGVSHRDRGELTGVAVGGGLEFALSRRVSATGEYRYTDFNQGVDSHAVTAGLRIRL